MDALTRTFDAVLVDRAAAEFFDDAPSSLQDRVRDLAAVSVEVELLGDTDDLDARLAGLASRGIASENVLIILDGRPARTAGDPGCASVSAHTRSDVLRIFDDQLTRRSERRVPPAGQDPEWIVVEAARPGPADAGLASVFTVGDGALATRGGLEENTSDATVLATGVYVGQGRREHLLPGPGWTALVLRTPQDGPSPSRRVLDLRSGLLVREEPTGRTPLRTARFASITRPGLHLLRAEGDIARLGTGPALSPPPEGVIESGTTDGVQWARTAGHDGGFAAVAVQSSHVRAGLRTIDRRAAYRADPWQVPAVAEARAVLDDAAGAGFDALLAEQRAAWADRWSQVDIEIPDDPSAQLALRFALFQLWTNVGCPVGQAGAERAVGARGLSGDGYAGHVFWDADMFVLPAMAMICPSAARAMLEYRIRRLPMARALAKASGRAGARFPWESARDGDEVTPTSMLLGTELISVRTGELEEHISADVAWAADQYATWTGDHEVLTGAGRPLIVETARYWASRIRRSADGLAHIDRVIGPDEYHEEVDDNAFTNVMARWNLRRGADLVGDPGEADAWRQIADCLVDGYHPQTGRHEQFAGYDQLTPLLATGLAPLPFAADLLLGREVVTGSQLIKQADVLMAHFVVPQEMADGSLAADLDFYAPRTSHGSSLSPAITAGLLARAGRTDEALQMLRLAMRLDLDDLTGSSRGGVHLATIGGVWQAVVRGFLGLSVTAGAMQVDPHLPSAWGSVRLRLRCQGAQVLLAFTPDRMTVSTDRPLRVRPAGSPELLLTRTAAFRRSHGEWRPE